MLQIETDESGQVGKVTFTLAEIDAEQHVSVVGDFNEWDPLAHPLEQDNSGRHSVTVELPVGASYHFKYLADDGAWFCDPDVRSANSTNTES